MSTPAGQPKKAWTKPILRQFVPDDELLVRLALANNLPVEQLRRARDGGLLNGTSEAA